MDNTIAPTIRLITDADSEALWRIRNLDSVRAASHSRTFIPRSVHNSWFLKYRANPNNTCWVVLVDKLVAGYCRVDNALVSIAIDQQFKGQGLGKVLLIEVIHRSQQRWQIIKAEIQIENTASLKLFELVGFKQTSVVNGYIYLEFHAA